MDGAHAVGRSIYCAVVDDHRDAVGGQLHVALENLGAGIDGCLEGSERVLRRDGREAAMGDQERDLVPAAAAHAEPKLAPPSTVTMVPVM